MTYLFPNRLSRHQLRFDSDEECDKCSLTQAPQTIITTIGAVAPLLTVPQQHCWCVHLECSINLPHRIKRESVISSGSQRANKCVLINTQQHNKTLTLD